jgi:D-threo-aldose 1-dehydrogenase
VVRCCDARFRLGSTSVAVTRLGFGAAPIGNLFSAVGDADASTAVDAAWRAGIRFFDTAPLYGHGLSERRLGAALRARPRDELVVATKVGRLLVPDAGPPPDDGFVATPPLRPVFDFSHDATLRALDDSLTRLGLDRVDVLHVHDPDAHADAALRGAFPALRRLRDEGVVGAIGAGMNQSALLARFVREAGVDCVLLAGRYTLLEQTALADLLPLCAERGVSVIAAGVFNSGLLADPSPGAHYDYRPASDDVIERARRLAAICARHDVALKAAALQFPLAHPAVACVLTGARSAAEVEENARLFTTPVPRALWDDLRAAGMLAGDAPTPTTSSTREGHDA